MLDQIKLYITCAPDMKHVTFWCDCGLHFRTYEILGYLQKNLFGVYKCSIRLCFFAEKHGKGVVDLLFAHIRRWIATALLEPKIVISDILALASVLRKGVFGERC